MVTFGADLIFSKVRPFLRLTNSHLTKHFFGCVVASIDRRCSKRILISRAVEGYVSSVFFWEGYLKLRAVRAKSISQCSGYFGLVIFLSLLPGSWSNGFGQISAARSSWRSQRDPRSRMASLGGLLKALAENDKKIGMLVPIFQFPTILPTLKVVGCCIHNADILWQWIIIISGCLQLQAPNFFMNLRPITLDFHDCKTTSCEVLAITMELQVTIPLPCTSHGVVLTNCLLLKVTKHIVLIYTVYICI